MSHSHDHDGHDDHGHGDDHGHDHDHDHEPHWLSGMRDAIATPIDPEWRTRTEPQRLPPRQQSKEEDEKDRDYVRWTIRNERMEQRRFPALSREEYRLLLLKRLREREKRKKDLVEFAIVRAWKVYFLTPLIVIMAIIALYFFLTALAYPIGYAIGVLIGVAILLFLLPIL